MSTLHEQASLEFVRRRHSTPLVALGALVAASAACGSGNSKNPTSPGSASLAVQITAPAGVTPIVIVTGPGAFRDTVHAATTLTGLAAGTYTVTAAPITSTDSIVGNVDTASVTGSPANLAGKDSATVTVNYVARTGTGGLWVGNVISGTAVRYAAGQLRSSTSLAPSTTLTTGQGAWGLAFDASGNLWVAQPDNNTVSMYASTQLGANGAPAPTVTLSATAGSLDNPFGLAFDHAGNLWVTNTNDSTVVEFTAAQLTSSGSPTPAVVIAASNGSLNAPRGLAFDSSGNLWIANQGDTSVVEFTPQQLGTSGTPQPKVAITSATGALYGLNGIAFDAQGNLWVALLTNNQVSEFSRAQLADSGTPTPKVTLSTNSGSLNGPVALAFDNSGNLWIANEGAGVVEIAASALSATGAPAPKVVVSGSGVSEPYGLAFDPHAPGLPLHP